MRRKVYAKYTYILHLQGGEQYQLPRVRHHPPMISVWAVPDGQRCQPMHEAWTALVMHWRLQLARLEAVRIAVRALAAWIAATVHAARALAGIAAL